MTTSSTARALHAVPSRPAISPAPFLKWAGGKGRLLGQLAPLLPPGAELMRHVEPFLGGGALFFARRPERALLCDVNPALIDTYRAIRDDVGAVIDHLSRYARRHDPVAFYAVRERYNRATRAPAADRAAMFVYLNKTCFNGLHRVNRRGEFNVPAGRYAKPRIFDDAQLRSVSAQLRHAELECTGFEALLVKARPGDFIYFDPPYAPVSKTASFTSYAQEGFGEADQERLRDVFRTLDKRGCKLMLSNSDVPLIRELYAGYPTSTVSAARAINSNAKKRGPVSEVVVRNYGR